MIHFKHSGTVSDLFYSLPSIKTACDLNDTQAILHLQVGMDNKEKFTEGYSHRPFMLIKEDVDSLKNLLKNQYYIDDVKIFDGDTTKINVDLDIFREQPINYKSGSIVRYFSTMMGLSVPFERPCINLKSNERYNRKVVLSRSLSYQNENVDWSVINDFPDVKFVFIGDDLEYQRISEKVNNLIHIKPKDYMDAAQIIKGCSLFIGNQNEYYSIAESLKVRRMLEVCPTSANVIPMGGENYDVHYTKIFKFLLTTLTK
jgi:hypothetical protein